MRSPRSLLTRAVTPGVQNRLLGDPRVVDRLLKTDRAAEILSHVNPLGGHGIDWLAQVALNNPTGVTDTLDRLAADHAHVGAAVDRLAARRTPVLTEEQVVDVFLSMDEFDRRQYWTNPRIQGAFLDFLCKDGNVGGLRDQVAYRFELADATSRVRVVIGDNEPARPTSGAADTEGGVALPVAADVLLSLNTAELSKLWDIETFRTTFIDSLVADEQLHQLRSLLRSDRLGGPEARKALFDDLTAPVTQPAG